MPTHFSFVLTAYGISFGVLIIYLLALWIFTKKLAKNDNE